MRMMSSRRTDPHVAVDVSGVFGNGPGLGRRREFRYVLISQDMTVGDIKAQVLTQLNFPSPELFVLRSGNEELVDSTRLSDLDESKLRKLNLRCKDVEAFHRALRERGLLRPNFVSFCNSPRNPRKGGISLSAFAAYPIERF